MAGAITWSTLTTVAVFLPLGLAGGLISQFFLPFALTVSSPSWPRWWWR